MKLAMVFIISAFFLLLPITEELNVKQAESMEYPPLGRLARLQGPVILTVQVGSDGAVVMASTREGNPILAKAAEENVKKWIFEAGRSGTSDLVFDFRLVNPELDCPRTTVRFNFPNRVTVTSNLQMPYH